MVKLKSRNNFGEERSHRKRYAVHNQLRSLSPIPRTGSLTVMFASSGPKIYDAKLYHLIEQHHVRQRMPPAANDNADSTMWIVKPTSRSVDKHRTQRLRDSAMSRHISIYIHVIVLSRTKGMKPIERWGRSGGGPLSLLRDCGLHTCT